MAFLLQSAVLLSAEGYRLMRCIQVWHSRCNCVLCSIVNRVFLPQIEKLMVSLKHNYCRVLTHVESAEEDQLPENLETIDVLYYVDLAGVE